MAEMSSIKGLAKLQQKLKAQTAQNVKKLARGLYRAGRHLQACSMDIVPVDTGNLKNSADTSPPKIAGTTVQVRVYYTANYALYVHENLNARHKPGKQAKFLEGPARTEQVQMKRIVNEAMR